MLLQVVFLALCYLAIGNASDHYNVAVKGALMCNGTAYAGGHIELFDYDFFYADDKLGETQSDKEGKFYIQGGRWEWVPMVPYFQLSEKCHGTLKCWKVWVPPDYQWTDGMPKKIYALGKLNLTDLRLDPC